MALKNLVKVNVSPDVSNKMQKRQQLHTKNGRKKHYVAHLVSI